ncbi:MAG: PaaX family transcriptional regulator [Rhodobacteraceae bacterium]|nr:PaaX family transcriptional regulator [Paracoccaceae bacterium]
MRSEPYTTSVDLLTGLAPQRVWSLVITIFGDLAQEKGQWLAGPTLTVMLAEMHVKPDAVRVALHRLRSDGWLTSEKAGRTSRHKLAAKGLKESQAATPIIYGAPKDMAKSWHIALISDDLEGPRETMQKAGYTLLHGRCYVGSDASRPPATALVLRPENAPDWILGSLHPEPLTGEFETLHTALEDVEGLLSSDLSLTDMQIAVLRALIVHNWRRLVLKHVDLPAELFDERWRGHACREAVLRLLERLPKPQLA